MKKNSVKLALLIAASAHKGQLDKGGKPYILHPIYVASALSSKKEKIVALLHDVFEDTSIEAKDIEMFFTKDILDALETITKKDDEAYFAYIKRVKENSLARNVKIEDLKHNMDLSRLPKITQEDKDRVKKYQMALAMLLEG